LETNTAHASQFYVFVLYLVKTNNDFTACNTASSIRDTALHCLRSVATE